MTKADIVENVNKKVGFAKKESVRMVELVFDVLKESLQAGQKVKITGFGTFSVRAKRARRGRNPQTGEEIEIKPRRILSFRPSNLLKGALNQKGEIQ